MHLNYPIDTAEHRTCHDDFPGAEQGRRTQRAHEERFSDRIVDRAGLFHRFVCGDLGPGPADHDFVRRGWGCAGGISRNQLSAPDLLDVYPAGNDQRNPGILPRHRRSEGDTVQHLYEYVGQSCGGIRDAASAAYGLRQSGVGQHDRLDRDAVVRDTVIGEIPAQRRVRVE